MIKTNNLYKIYENGSIAVRNVSLELPSFGFVAIVGNSGCGKSTLLNLLSRNDIPSKGELIYNDKAYREYGKSVLLKDFAYIYQDFKLIDNLTIYQNIKLGHELVNKDIDNDFILSVAERLGLKELLDEKVFALSGGQQQRVAIARALVRKPKVVFADEPTGNLDSANSENVYNILKEISKDILVVIVSHDKAISGWADRIIEMESGKVIGDYSSEEYKKVVEEKALQESLMPMRDVLDTNIDKHQNKVVKKESKKKNKANKHTKIGAKSIFSSTKGANKTRKKQGLTNNSIFVLMLAFNNNSLGKKITLLILSALMVMLIFWTTAVIFTSPDATFCRLLKQNDIPYVNMGIYSRNVGLGATEYGKVEEYIKEKTGNVTFTAGHCLHNKLSEIRPTADASMGVYGDYISVDMWDAIYTDNPEEVGLKMILGTAPKINAERQDEIAISKTFYDYFLQVGKFVNCDGEIVDFSKRDLIGSYISEFRFKITGVFDDQNDYNMHPDIEVFDLNHYNNLVYMIIRPRVAFEEAKVLQGYSSNLALNNFNYDKGLNSGYFYFAPDNSITRKYFYNCEGLGEKLEDENGVYVTEWFALDYRFNMGKELEVGDTIRFDLVTTGSNMGFLFVDKIIEKNITFKVKGIVKNLNNYDMLLNEKVFNQIMSPYYNGGTSFIINSKFITPRFIKKLRKFIYNNLSPEIKAVTKDNWQHENFSVDFYAPKISMNDEYYNDVVDIARFYIGLPLCILASIAYAILLCVLMSDMVKEKGKDILVLRSLNATNLDIFKIFGGVMLVMLAFQFIVGCSLGGGLVHGLNLFWMLAGDMDFYLPTFFISPLSVFVMLIAIFVISSGAMFYSINKLFGKNLRKSFQKQKK